MAFAENFIRAFQAGQQVRLRREQEGQEAEERADRRKLLTLQIKAAELREKLDPLERARQEAIQTHQARIGQPGPPLLTPDPVTGEPTHIDELQQPYVSTVIPSGIPGGESTTFQAPTEGKLESQKLKDLLTKGRIEQAQRAIGPTISAGAAGERQKAQQKFQAEESEKERQNRLAIAKMGPAGVPPPTQLTTITTPEGPKLVEYTPSRAGGQGSVRIVQEGSVRGTVSPIGEGTQRELTSLGTSAYSLDRIKQLLPSIKTGPIWGRIRNVKVGALGGWGATPDEVRVSTQINMLMRSAFDIAGANFTGPEMKIFRSIYPRDEDTLETALVKIDEALDFVKKRMEIRQGLMTPMQRTQTKMPTVGAGAVFSPDNPYAK